MNESPNLAQAQGVLDAGDLAMIEQERDRLLQWHAAHHGGRNAPLDGWEKTRGGAIQGAYCTGCQVWPVIIALHNALQGTSAQTITAADIARTDADTEDHIGKVQTRMAEIVEHLKIRATLHDASKRLEPERSGYAALQARLGDIRYGTPEYRVALDEARPVIEHHYAFNDHHPEHHSNGIAGMNLLSLLEMLADWKAAGERTKAGSMRQSLDVNRRRFGPDDMLYGILENTARELGWLEDPAP